jgi:NAD(P)-dependent dehydrogenase (short-subunit alcohol dehydrogenase family)
MIAVCPTANAMSIMVAGTARSTTMDPPVSIQDPEQVAKQAAAEASTGRCTHPHEVADLVLLLASDRAGNVTGTDVHIDGELVKTL